MKLFNEKILIIGGSGSLGNKLIETYLEHNEIINYSRDENKHWSMELKYKSSRLKNVIGDIRNKDKVNQTLIRHQPTIVIIAAALKHVDRCEYEINECIDTNILGIQNILDSIETNLLVLTKLKIVCFISTDKACSPVNVYGMCKSTCEALIVEKSKYIPSVKFVSVRYGNVLNSRGSIIPILTNKCEDGELTHLTLTSNKMTRFIMTLEESVALIEYAMLEGKSGEIVIPKLPAMMIKDLFELFSEKYNKSIKITGLRSGEKIHESLINETQAIRTVDNGKYYHIQPSYFNNYNEENQFHYHSGIEQVGKEELLSYLSYINLFTIVPNTITNLDYMIQSLQNINITNFTEIHRFIRPDIAFQAQKEVLSIEKSAWNRYENTVEQYWGLSDKSKVPNSIKTVVNDLISSEFTSQISQSLKLNQINKTWWNIYLYYVNDKVSITNKNGNHTIAIFLSENPNSPNLEIWDGEYTSDGQMCENQKIITITPIFNQAILFTKSSTLINEKTISKQKTSSTPKILLTVSFE